MTDDWVSDGGLKPNAATTVPDDRVPWLGWTIPFTHLSADEIERLGVAFYEGGIACRVRRPSFGIGANGGFCGGDTGERSIVWRDRLGVEHSLNSYYAVDGPTRDRSAKPRRWLIDANAELRLADEEESP